MFIRVTDKTDGARVIVNVNNINVIAENNEENTTIIFFKGTDTVLEVKESFKDIEEVFGRINCM